MEKGPPAGAPSNPPSHHHRARGPPRSAAPVPRGLCPRGAGRTALAIPSGPTLRPQSARGLATGSGGTPRSALTPPRHPGCLVGPGLRLQAPFKAGEPDTALPQTPGARGLRAGEVMEPEPSACTSGQLCPQQALQSPQVSSLRNALAAARLGGGGSSRPRWAWLRVGAAGWELPSCRVGPAKPAGGEGAGPQRWTNKAGLDACTRH